jgi:HPt (histidine-containing phosphotransfer) domain-containing protein
MNSNTAVDDPADQPVTLDPAALARLQELDPDGRHGVVRRVLVAYESSLQRMLVQLRDAPEAAVASALAGVAHTLKSSSASVGARELTRTCAEIESRLRAGNTSALAGDLARMVKDAEAAHRAVKAILRQ